MIETIQRYFINMIWRRTCVPQNLRFFSQNINQKTPPFFSNLVLPMYYQQLCYICLPISSMQHVAIHKENPKFPLSQPSPLICQPFCMAATKMGATSCQPPQLSPPEIILSPKGLFAGGRREGDEREEACLLQAPCLRDVQLLGVQGVHGSQRARAWLS